MNKLEKIVSNLKEGETAVSVYEVENQKGSFLFIGDNIVNHLWAVTEEELKQLYTLLKRRYENTRKPKT